MLAAMEPCGMIQAMTQPGPVTQVPVKASDSKTGTVMAELAVFVDDDRRSRREAVATALLDGGVLVGGALTDVVGQVDPGREVAAVDGDLLPIDVRAGWFEREGRERGDHVLAELDREGA